MDVGSISGEVKAVEPPKAEEQEQVKAEEPQKVEEQPKELPEHVGKALDQEA